MKNIIGVTEYLGKKIVANGGDRSREAMEVIRPKNGEDYYWILFYSFLSPQQSKTAEAIVELLQPHIPEISYRTYYRKRKEAIDALSSVLWGYTSKDSLAILEQFFPKK